MNIIIFSKNRGCQLDLFLRSMKYYYKEWKNDNISILYKSSNNDFLKGYDITINKHKDIKFIQETNFKRDVLSLIDDTEKFTVFFVDDNIFKEKFTIGDSKMKLFSSNEKILCLSLRLHPDLNYCYPARVKMKKPHIDKDNIFDWRGKNGDFGYPMSLDGHIFKTDDILPLLHFLKYNNPNSLESTLSTSPIKKPLMIMYDKSIIMNNPINKVQNFNNNIHGNISAKFLNENYLNNKTLLFDIFKGFENYSCHQEIEIIFE